jgi:ubiquinone biosynthesis monooxygenase Coq7
MGPAAVYATVAAIENFVHSHYQGQITRLKGRADHHQLLAMLESCSQDELDHLEDAHGRLLSPPGICTRVWCRAIGAGSVVGVWLAKRV